MRSPRPSGPGKLFPDTAGFYFLAARSNFDAGNLPEAVTHMQRAVELSPETPEIHRFFGSVLATNGDAEQALLHFRKSIELDPQNASAYLNMARLFDQMGRDQRLSGGRAERAQALRGGGRSGRIEACPLGSGVGVLQVAALAGVGLGE